MKRTKRKYNFHYVAIPRMTSNILKSVDFTKTQKSRYLESETLFFLQIKKFANYTSRATLLEKIVFVAEVTFNTRTEIWRPSLDQNISCNGKLYCLRPLHPKIPRTKSDKMLKKINKRLNVT